MKCKVIPICRGKLIRAKRDLPYFLKLVLRLEVPSWQSDIVKHLQRAYQRKDYGTPT